MSPEELSFSSTSVKSDIWSCGVILYELLTGKVPFSGNSGSEVLSSI